MAQDDYYYEIQLTNKQLVFYFVAGAMGLILSFLAGVMVGRGVDASSGDVPGTARSAQVIHEDTVVPEPVRPASPPPASELQYSGLDKDRGEEKLQKAQDDKAAAPPKSGPDRPAATPRPVDKAPVAAASATPPRPSPAPTVRAASPAPAPVRSTPPKAAASAPPHPAAGGAFTVQVGAFKEKPAADSIAARLKTKGFAAYVAEGAGGLFNVRVGSYTARTDAERVSAKLRDEEKFKPFIVPK